MIPAGSDPGNAATVSTQWSHDGAQWRQLPDGVTVTGSEWALVLDRLEHVAETINLAAYEVAVGAQAARPATEYLRHRVGQGMLRALVGPLRAPAVLPVVLRGRLVEPYAVFLR